MAVMVAVMEPTSLGTRGDDGGDDGGDGGDGVDGGDYGGDDGGDGSYLLRHTSPVGAPNREAGQGFPQLK